MKLNSNTVIILLVTLAIAGGAYWYFFVGTGNDTALIASTTDNPAQEQFKSLASEMKSISFDTDIFSDPRFTSLTDIETPVTSETKGRVDPFAPFSAAAAATVPAK